MNPDQLPLFELFTRLREHGLPLGIDEYMAVVHALRSGFGVESLDALQQLCRTVWIKTEEEQRVFTYLFEYMLKLDSQPIVPESHEEVSRPESSSSSSIPKHQPRPKFEAEEPVQIAKAVRQSGHHETELKRSHYALLTEYFPVTQRQMKQSWRYLRRPVREGPLEEVDVEATIEKIGREGVLLEPVLVPRRVNRARLMLLIDQDGSMVPFHSLSRQLVETLQRGGRLEQTDVYYFHDYPKDYVYHEPARLNAKPLDDMLEHIDERTGVLIVSDAGAARGNLENGRIKQTEAFILQLKQAVRSLAWLNPMPNNRWQHTSAGQIARFALMFEMSRQGLDAAINVLRGRYVYWEKIYPWMLP